MARNPKILLPKNAFSLKTIFLQFGQTLVDVFYIETNHSKAAWRKWKLPTAALRSSRHHSGDCICLQLVPPGPSSERVWCRDWPVEGCTRSPRLAGHWDRNQWSSLRHSLPPDSCGMLDLCECSSSTQGTPFLKSPYFHITQDSITCTKTGNFISDPYLSWRNWHVFEE